MSATTSLILDLRRSGLSQSEIARRTGIPQPRLSRWENGEAPDSADDALKLQKLHADSVARPAPSCGAIRPPCGAAETAEAGHAG